MTAMARYAGSLIALLLLAPVAPVHGNGQASGGGGGGRQLIIVTGLGGESYYDELFRRWADGLREVARERLGLRQDQIHHLAPQLENVSRNMSPGASAGITGPSTRDEVLAAIADAARRTGAGDLVAIVLIGHGSAQPGADGVRARFNLPGPDLSPGQLALALDALAGRTVVVVNTASASGPFLQALSAPGRIIIAATSSAAENQHARFAGHFVAAFADDAADSDKNRQISVLEAFNYATRSVAEEFRGKRLMQTEHAVLDDSGDGAGSRAPTAHGAAADADGALAARTHLAAADPLLAGVGEEARARLRLQVESRRLVDSIEALKRRKPFLQDDLYQQQLESLLLELALNRRAYRGRHSP